MRPLLSALAVIVTLVSGCATSDQVQPGTAVDDGLTVSPEELTTESPPTTTPDATSACTPAPTSTSAPTSSETTASTLASTTTQAPTTPSTDPELAAQQQRLADLGYWLGPVDGRFGSMTAHAVTAFQKAEGLPRTGQLDIATTDRLAVAATPAARSGGGTVLEIDLARQILLVAVDGVVTRIYDTATGAPATPTPAGQFQIHHQIDGFRHAPLGTLYRPKYFNGGIALHGYTSVPAQPASHGCVRLTYPAMDDLWASGRAPVGTQVWVY